MAAQEQPSLQDPMKIRGSPFAGPNQNFNLPSQWLSCLSKKLWGEQLALNSHVCSSPTCIAMPFTLVAIPNKWPLGVYFIFFWLPPAGALLALPQGKSSQEDKALFARL